MEDLHQILKSIQVPGNYIFETIILLGTCRCGRLDEAEMNPANIHENIDNTLLILNNRLTSRVGKEIRLFTRIW